MMSVDEALQDVATRRRQLEAHILTSPEYLGCANRELKRRVTYLYIAIGILAASLVVFLLQAAHQLPAPTLALNTCISLLAVVNCILVIQTKHCLHRINEAWLNPQERETLHTLRQRQDEIVARLSPPRDSNAALN